jgi:GTP cyclohydrolase I
MTTNDQERSARIAEHVRAMLDLLGVDPVADPEVAETPERVAELALELTAGMGADPSVTVLPDRSAGHGLVIARDLPFHSLCAHHLLPFFGRAHIGYLPGDGVVGIGALGGVLDHFASRLQLQERLGEQIADFLERATGARGVIVLVEARQLCMEMRGRKKAGLIQSTASRGALVEGDLRREFFDRVLAPPAEEDR